MLTPEQINNIHRLHWVEKQSVRKIARQLHLGRRTIAKYLTTPAPPPVHRDRSSKLDSFKPSSPPSRNCSNRIPPSAWL